MITYKIERKKLIIPNGFECCGGSSSDCSAEVARAYSSGWSGGYNQGRASCPECSGCGLEHGSITLTETGGTFYPTTGAGFDSVTIDASAVYDDGYSDGQASCPSCDCESAITEAYQSGITYQKSLLTTTAITANGVYERPDGYDRVEVNVEDAPQLEVRSYNLEADWSGESGEVHPNSQLGFSGFRYFSVNDVGYGQAKYNQGYAAGLADCSGDTPCDCTEQVDNAHYRGCNEGKNSVIKSLLTENDTDYVIGYYYTSARTMCLITGEYSSSTEYFDGNACVSAMSINGGAWQSVEKYLELAAGWTQIRFDVCNNSVAAMFSHRFTPSRECEMDALKVVSLPSKITGLTNTYTFHMNDGLRVLSSSCGLMRNATNGADNVNVVITHYSGAQREYTYFPQSGVFFIPAGSSSAWTGVLSNWTHIELV